MDLMTSRVQDRAEKRSARLREEQRQGRSRRRRLALLGGAGAVAAIVVALGVILAGGSSHGTSPPRNGEAAAGVAKTRSLFAGVPQSATTLGDPKAPANLIVFADLQCPFCRDYDLNVLPTLVQRYVRPGTLRLELREIGLIGPASLKAAAWAGAAARQNRLYQFADLFYRNQGTENSGYVTDGFLSKIATGAGMDVAQARRYASSPSVRRKLANTTNAAQSAGVTGTPTFYVGRGNSLRQLPVNSYEPQAFSAALDSVINGR
jgi:protein-disulfide isomerase